MFKYLTQYNITLKCLIQMITLILILLLLLLDSLLWWILYYSVLNLWFQCFRLTTILLLTYLFNEITNISTIFLFPPLIGSFCVIDFRMQCESVTSITIVSTLYILIFLWTLDRRFKWTTIHLFWFILLLFTFYSILFLLLPLTLSFHKCLTTLCPFCSWIIFHHLFLIHIHFLIDHLLSRFHKFIHYLFLILFIQL